MKNNKIQVTSIEYIRPLLECVWTALLASISVLLEESDDP